MLDPLKDISQYDSLKPNELIIELVKVANLLNIETQKKTHITNVPEFSNGYLKDLILKYNEMIQTGELFYKKIDQLQQFKARKYKNIADFNRLINKIKSEQLNEIPTIINQAGGGLLSYLTFATKYGDKKFITKLQMLDDLQKAMKTKNEEIYTNDIKNIFEKYKASIRAYSAKIKDVTTSSKYNSKITNNYYNLLNRYIKLIQLISMSTKYDDKNILSLAKSPKNSRVDLDSRLLNILDILAKPVSSESKSASSESEIARLNKKTRDQQNKIAEYDKKIKALQKAVQQYKQSIRTKGTGAIPTLSEAIRFSKVHSLLGVSPRRLAATGDSKGVVLDGIMQDGVDVQQSQQVQLSSESLTRLNELFSAEFINELKTKKKYSILRLLIQFNNEKTKQFIKRSPASTEVDKFIEFMKKLKEMSDPTKRSVLYDKIKTKYTYNSDYQNNIVELNRYMIQGY
jgi:hypothetical protein